MSLTIKTGGTCAVTGGTDEVLTRTAQNVQNGVSLAAMAVSEFRVRPGLTLKAKLPTLMSDGTYSKGKNTSTYVRPFILSSGKTSFQVVRIETEIHPEYPAADAANLRQIGAQLAFDSELTNFWLGGDISL